jgi:RNA polymerase sigma-B factor
MPSTASQSPALPHRRSAGARRAETGISERWLLERYRRHGDTAAREELVRRMMPLVRRVASAYPTRGHGDDLLQVAALGLVKAIDRYDASFGVPLRTYAIPTMFGEVRRYLRDHSWSVRVPRPLQERVLDVTKAVDRLSASTGHAPTPQQVAEELGLTLEETLEALQAGAAHTATSFDAPTTSGEEGERALGDVLGYDDTRFDRAEEVAALRSLRGVLDDRDRTVLYLRFVEDLTQTEIAKRVGVSQMQVSRLLRRSLQRLNAAATAPAV